ncbi:hypothetical protein EC839_106121 [Pseudomonas sp. JUb52]|nr:hypothetical protein EC839_106121 [Pseudomonas sp. JUb52]
MAVNMLFQGSKEDENRVQMASGPRGANCTPQPAQTAPRRIGVVPIPVRLIQSPRYRALSFSARMVFVELCAQATYVPSGWLTATRPQALEWGLKSQGTLAKALDDLHQANFITCTDDEPGLTYHYRINVEGWE